ncbi:Sn1-specific diacylglycerol lipase alpha [Symbiodinium microadriaticum]|uniref:sn-1-specific diacylglycerol lipase n=1 Tax=Symbiodinium microadriaticum TaxID=2951 RepID=A0A1Q9CG83_SYMMI|nr:Sn1-specific diacylglycerol lipase alpha [Symbiodinium microadriaticum]
MEFVLLEGKEPETGFEKVKRKWLQRTGVFAKFGFEVFIEKIQMRWSWRMFRLASVHVLTLANAQAEIQQRLESRHIFVVVGATTTDQPWLRAQWEQFGIRYVPVMVQPHPVWAQPLQQMAEEMNGVFYPNVAWTADGLKKRLNVASNPLYGTGLDSIFRTRGLHDTRGQTDEGGCHDALTGLRQWILGTLQRLAGGAAPVRLDPFGTAELLHQALKDIALTREQQDVFERVVACNAHFWQVAVDGCLDGSPPWRRHVALNLALLRVYHRHLGALRIVDGLSHGSVCSLSYSEALEALRYCRWALAVYGGRGLRDGTEKIDSEGTSKMAEPPSSSARSQPDEEERVAMAAAVAECEPDAILVSDMDDAAQASDPLCPRFLLAEDVQRRELIVSVRGTQSLSDLFADLVGDAEDFAGGKAHSGILQTARRLLDRLHPQLQEGLSRLEELGRSSNGSSPSKSKKRLVLCGHSLGAGVCELLAILMLGGEDAAWTLPKGTELKVFLFAPPPVFGSEPVQRASSFSRLWSFGFRPAVPSAVQRARDSSLAFAMNYDIIPRTSLHNGYKLFQEARAIDDFVDWGKRDVLRKLGQGDAETQVGVARELEDALCKGASTRPATGNPFPVQHAVTSRLCHVLLVPGGTASFSSSGQLNPAECRDGEDAVDHRAHGRWVLKRSDHLRQWRRRFAWIEAGELCFAVSPKDPLRSSVALTADSTLIMLLGQPSSLPFPVGMGPTMSFRASEPNSGTNTESTMPAARDFATPWAFRVQTASTWSGIELPSTGEQALPAVRSCLAAEVFLCTESAAERDAWLVDLAAAVRAARQRCIRVLPAVPSEDFGREALLADGLMNDHDAGRYEVALEALIEQLRCVECPEEEKKELPIQSINATTVDIARVFRENIREDDEVVMRMDCEGSEYVLLRHLMLSGWLCKLRRLYLEAHAMSRPKLNRFRTFDVILPWLLEPCGTEVYVDTGYHNTAESLALWPKQDGVCRWCPMLYVPFQGASPRRCPAASIRQCFDATYTCERCCNVERFGPLGDLDCWRRGRPVAGSRLKSGGLGYSLPQDVLQRILDTSRALAGDGEAILRLVGAQATPPHPAIFSYEMCCASMVGELVPGLSPFFHHQSSGEYYGADVRAQKPQAARPWAVFMDMVNTAAQSQMAPQSERLACIEHYNHHSGADYNNHPGSYDNDDTCTYDNNDPGSNNNHHSGADYNNHPGSYNNDDTCTSDNNDPGSNNNHHSGADYNNYPGSYNNHDTCTYDNHDSRGNHLHHNINTNNCNDS